MDAPQEKFVVQTEFCEKLQREYKPVRTDFEEKYKLIGVLAVMCIFFGAVMFPALITLAAGSVLVLGIFCLVFGVIIILLVVFPPRPNNKSGHLPIKPNKITLTFGDEGVGVEVTGGISGEPFFSYYVLPSIYSPGNSNDIKRYGTEYWLYRDLNVHVVGDYFWIAKNFVTYGIVFRESQIIEGDPVRLRKMLKEKLGSKYKEEARIDRSKPWF